MSNIVSDFELPATILADIGTDIDNKAEIAEIAYIDIKNHWPISIPISRF